jgi:hypothetical protein
MKYSHWYDENKVELKKATYLQTKEQVYPEVESFERNVYETIHNTVIVELLHIS